MSRLQTQMVHMVRMLSLLMADQLRSAVLSSVAAYLSMWQQFVQQDCSQPAPLEHGAAAAGGVMVSAAAACTQSSWCLASSSLTCSSWRHASRRGLHRCPPVSLLLASCTIFVQARWNADQSTLAHKPLFGIRLVVSESRIVYEPSLADVQAGVLSCFDAILTRTDGIEDITSKVGPVLAGPALGFSRSCCSTEGCIMLQASPHLRLVAWQQAPALLHRTDMTISQAWHIPELQGAAASALTLCWRC